MFNSLNLIDSTEFPEKPYHFPRPVRRDTPPYPYLDILGEEEWGDLKEVRHA